MWEKNEKVAIECSPKTREKDGAGADRLVYEGHH